MFEKIKMNVFEWCAVDEKTLFYMHMRCWEWLRNIMLSFYTQIDG